jgi:hypothetical protein
MNSRHQLITARYRIPKFAGILGINCTLWLTVIFSFRQLNFLDRFSRLIHRFLTKKRFVRAPFLSIFFNHALSWNNSNHISLFISFIINKLRNYFFGMVNAEVSW